MTTTLPSPRPPVRILKTAEAEQWFARLDADYPNLVSALVWSRDHGHTDQLCRLVAALAPIWVQGGTSLRLPATVGIEWMDAAFAAGDALTPRALGLLTFHRSVLAFLTLDFETAVNIAQEGISLARAHNDDLVLGRFLLPVALSLGLAKASEPVWEEAIGALRRAADTFNPRPD